MEQFGIQNSVKQQLTEQRFTSIAGTVVGRKPKTWFGTADDDKFYLCLRYETRALELVKDKSAMKVGDKSC